MLDNVEINVFNITNGDVRSVVKFVNKHTCPAVVVMPKLAAPFMVERSISGGKFKIIIATDFSTGGKTVGLNKFIELKDVGMSDGFDVLLTRTLNESAAGQELNIIRGLVNQTSELRWTLDFNTWSESEINTRLKMLHQYPSNFIRSSPSVLPIHTDKDVEKIISTIKSVVNRPIKISGRFSREIIEANRNLRFDMSYTDAVAMMNPKPEVASK